MDYVFLALIVLALPIMTIAGFVMALGLRARTLRLEERLGALELALAAGVQKPRDAAAEASPAEAPESTEAEEVGEVAQPDDALEQPPAPSAPDGVIPQPPRPGLEERLGSRWAVWVGGVALALGGFLLVRFSVEQGYFGPEMRLFGAAVLALALIGAGEWFRRREREEGLVGIPSAHVPSVLTAAGTATAFATVYAAYGLYAFISPATAFVLLGVISLGTLTAAVLHGPALAALGLLAALASPLLVSTQEPDPWALVIYLVFPVGAAYALARLRHWRWLAVAAALGAALWGVVIALNFEDQLAPALCNVIIQTLLAAIMLVVDPNRGVSDEEAHPDLLALGVLAAFALLAVLASTNITEGPGWAWFGGGMALLHLAIAVFVAPAAGAALFAAAIATATLALWPVVRIAETEPQNVLPGGPGGVPLPDALHLYLGFGIIIGAALAGASLWRLMRGRRLAFLPAACYAAAATLGPLALLVVAYWRVEAFAASIPFALAAGALALGATVIAGFLRAHQGEARALPLGVAAFAAAAVAALALGLTFALEKGMLTVAFALAALGTAWVAAQTRIWVLRYVVGALGVIVLGRIIWDPAIAGSDLGTTPIFNWLLWGYGVPALSFALSARILAHEARDRVTRLSESLAIVFSALLVFFEIRHWINDGDILRPASGLVEAGLMATAGLLFSIVMVRLDARRPDAVYRIASLAFGAFTLVIAFGLLTITKNPYVTGTVIVGGAIINGLLLGYLIPAIAALALAWSARRTRPRWYVRLAAGLGLLLQLLYMLTEIRRLFQGPTIGFNQPTGETELWVYSVALVAMGVILLAVGLLWNIRLARLLSAAYILVAVLKVFLIDLASLEGALRALSFIGLGLVLVGIGFAYQKLLARTRAAPPAPS
jgi:uncharacterized membrane protein